MEELPFFAEQKKIVLSNCGFYDPESIEEYIARGGYRAFVKTIRHYTFEEVCNIIERSGLRGRSGGGYLTGMKWKRLLIRVHLHAYLFAMPRRVILAHSATGPFLKAIRIRLVEGIAIASYAIGAYNAMVY